MQDFKLSTAHAKFHQICTLKSTEELYLMTLKSDARFEEKLICCFKLTRIWWILTQALESLKNVLFDWLLCAKNITFDLKKNRGVTFHGTEERCKIWRKTDLWFAKWHEEFGKLSPEHSKVSKLGLRWDPFSKSRKCMSLKFMEELCVMTLKNDAQFLRLT